MRRVCWLARAHQSSANHCQQVVHACLHMFTRTCVCTSPRQGLLTLKRNYTHAAMEIPSLRHRLLTHIMLLLCHTTYATPPRHVTHANASIGPYDLSARFPLLGCAERTRTRNRSNYTLTGQKCAYTHHATNQGHTGQLAGQIYALWLFGDLVAPTKRSNELRTLRALAHIARHATPHTHTPLYGNWQVDITLSMPGRAVSARN